MAETKTKPKVVAVSVIKHGYWDEDANEGAGGNVVKTFDIEDELTDEFFTEEEIQGLIEGGSAVDVAGVLQERAGTPEDEATAKRDAILKMAGKPVLVDTSNPRNFGQDTQHQIELEDENAKLKAELESLKAEKAPEPEVPTGTSTKPIGSTAKK